VVGELCACFVEVNYVRGSGFCLILQFQLLVCNWGSFLDLFGSYVLYEVNS
jgi:hypothetical protein